MNRAAGLAELLESKLVSEKVTKRLSAVRYRKLRSFLDQHQHSSQWATGVAALVDATRSNLVPAGRDIAQAIAVCGHAGQLECAKALYTTFHAQLGIRRSLSTHLAFLNACADCANFSEASAHFTRLRQRDAKRWETDPSHAPAVTDQLLTPLLRAAVAHGIREGREPEGNVRRRYGVPLRNGRQAGDGVAATGGASSPQESSCGAAGESTWAAALRELVFLRRHSNFRRHVALTPQLLEQAALLAELGGQWEGAIQLIQSCDRQATLVPPETYDAAMRTCFRHRRHDALVMLMTQYIASRNSPDERSVRLALISAEEVQSRIRREGSDAQQLTGTPVASIVIPPAEPWALSLTLFQSIENNGLPMYQQTYEAPLRTCALAGRWEEALRVLRVMKRDGRPVEPHVYRLVLCSRLEQSVTLAEAERLAQLPVMKDSKSTVVYAALLRCCLRIRDWKGFSKVSREMKNRDIPETYETIQLLMIEAYRLGKWHSALMRYARFENITSYERERVRQDKLVQEYDADFHMPAFLVDMALDAYDKLQDRRDPMVEVAYQAAMKRKAQGLEQLTQHGPIHTPSQPWMFSRKDRETQHPPEYF